jgi:hypothetical protein
VDVIRNEVGRARRAARGERDLRPAVGVQRDVQRYHLAARGAGRDGSADHGVTERDRPARKRLPVAVDHLDFHDGRLTGFEPRLAGPEPDLLSAIDDVAHGDVAAGIPLGSLPLPDRVEEGQDRCDSAASRLGVIQNGDDLGEAT